ncbi:MAG TPA: histidine triad nucleotide-binding protein [Syntrophaceae bacterium]|jgi:histidine triad (HIT) family protein|nr:histidine triad nucleotide-binding protein [Syntrophaceae bacterium]
MRDDCIFCKIVNGTIPSSRVYEDDDVMAFDDIHPMAPVHVIIIPKRHIATLMDVTADNMKAVSSLINAAREVARVKGIDKRGFRTVINCNEEGGQVIFHLHMHVLGGKKLKDELD